MLTFIDALSLNFWCVVGIFGNPLLKRMSILSVHLLVLPWGTRGYFPGISPWRDEWGLWSDGNCRTPLFIPIGLLGTGGSGGEHLPTSSGLGGAGVFL